MMLQEILRRLETLDSWVSNMEVVSLVQGNMDRVKNKEEGSMMENFHRSANYYQDMTTRPTKIEFPVFDGRIFKSERFFELDSIPAELKVSIASIYLIRLTIDWHYAFVKNRKIAGLVSWEEYVTTMSMRFGPNELKRLIAQLKRFREGVASMSM